MNMSDKTVKGTVTGMIKTDQTSNVIGSGTYVPSPFKQLVVIRLDEVIESWPGHEDFWYVAVHPDVLAGFWERIKARVRGTKRYVG